MAGSKIVSARIINPIPVDEFIRQSGMKRNRLINLAIEEYIRRNQDLVKAPC
jgi:hypothetical protein